MVKIALQLSGRIRFTQETLDSFAKYIIPLCPDVFCSFWSPKNHDCISTIHSVFNPLAIELEDQSLIKPIIDEPFTSKLYSNLPSMSYKFYRVAALRQAYELQTGQPYDIIIQARTDNLFFEPLDLTDLPIGISCSNQAWSENIDPYVNPRMVDNFYVGDRSSIDLASTTFWHLHALVKDMDRENKFHQMRIPEIIQTLVWNNLNIKIHSLKGNSPTNNFWYDIDRRDSIMQ